MSPPRAEIITVGTELLTHGRVDTNSAELGRLLTDMGFLLRRRATVVDDRGTLIDALREAAARAGLVLVTGGLGPTADDISRDALAQAFGRRLQVAPRLVAELEERFREHGLTMPRSNLRQAEVPEGAEALPNPEGSAPGLWLEHDGGVVLALPGPPSEMRAVLSSEVKGRMKRRFAPSVSARRSVLTSGLAESALEDRIVDLYPARGPMELTVLARPGLVEVLVVSTRADALQAEAEVEDLSGKLRERLQDAAFSRSETGDSLAALLGGRLRRGRRTVAVAESCTGGLLGAELTETPGSSAYFLGGVIAYSNRSKEEQLDVPADLLGRHGAVSGEVAQAMAQGVRRRFAADFGIGITGVAGPGGGTDAKPVGLVWLGLDGPGGCSSVSRRIVGSRERVRRWAVAGALQLLRVALESEDGGG